jgi:hypothetical protein
MTSKNATSRAIKRFTMPFEIGDKLEDELAFSERGFKLSPKQLIDGDNHSVEMEDSKYHQFNNPPSYVPNCHMQYRPRRYSMHEVYEK